MSRSCPIVLLLALACMTGCSAAVDSAAELELGTGTWRFEALEDGQSVDLVRGAQGGWHVWISVRTHGIAADEGRLTLTMQPEDESAPPQVTEVNVRLDPPDPDGCRVFLGWPAVVRDASCRTERMLRVEARLAADDHELVAERYIVPSGGAYPPPACETP